MPIKTCLEICENSVNQLCLTRVAHNSLKTDKPVALEFPIELEFRNVGFCGGRKTGEPGEKPSEQGKNQPGPGFEPGPHWWEASALTTAPTLLPCKEIASYPSLFFFSEVDGIRIERNVSLLFFLHSLIFLFLLSSLIFCCCCCFSTLGMILRPLGDLKSKCLWWLGPRY